MMRKPCRSIGTGLLQLSILSVAACSDRPLDRPSDLDLDLGYVDMEATPTDMAYIDLSIELSDMAHADLSFVIADLAHPHPDLSFIPDLARPDLAPPIDMAIEICKSIVVTTLTGNGTRGSVDGSGGAAGTTQLYGPGGIALDSAGTLYVAEADGNRIRKVAPDGSSTTLTGNGQAGFVDGTGGRDGTTELNYPGSITLDGAGNLYVADYSNNRIRRVAADGTTTTLTGNGIRGFFDGTGGAMGTTELNSPFGLALSNTGTLYVTDFGGLRIRKVAPDGTTTTLTGNGTTGSVDGTGGANGTTEFRGPAGLALDGAGNVYVAEYEGYRIRKVAPDGTTSTLTGNGMAGYADGSGGANGTTRFGNPVSAALDGDGNLYVGDEFNNRIRKVAPDGTTVTVAGDGTAGFVDGNACTARFSYPAMIVVAGKQLYVSDYGNNRIRVLQLP
jgi:sugar lactone lactonase YvrE